MPPCRHKSSGLLGAEEQRKKKNPYILNTLPGNNTHRLPSHFISQINSQSQKYLVPRRRNRNCGLPHILKTKKQTNKKAYFLVTYSSSSILICAYYSMALNAILCVPN